MLIPVLDEGPVLERTVPTMLAQRLDRGEIEFLFAEGRSGDDSRARLERFAAHDPRVRFSAALALVAKLETSDSVFDSEVL